VAVDQDAYQQEIKRLEETLSKIAISKDSVVLKAEPAEYYDARQRRVHDTTGDVVVAVADAHRGPKIQDSLENAWCFWVCSRVTGKISNQKWNAYVLPGNPDENFMKLLSPVVGRNQSLSDRTEFDERVSEIEDYNRYNASKMSLSLAFQSQSGKTILEDKREITNDLKYSLYDSFPFSVNRAPLMLNVQSRNKKTSYLEQVGPSKNHRASVEKSITHAYLAPFAFMHVKNHDGSKDLMVSVSKRTFLFRVKATPEELKSIADVICKVEHTPDPAISK
jgi:hypothetical protein